MKQDETVGMRKHQEDRKNKATCYATLRGVAQSGPVYQSNDALVNSKQDTRRFSKHSNMPEHVQSVVIQYISLRRHHGLLLRHCDSSDW